jgi:NADPH:quinone reductase-like Zn-dependent oxidoreductase
MTTAGSDDKLDKAIALGADLAVNYRAEDVAARAREWTRGAGIDVIIDPVGAGVWRGNLDAIRRGGRMVCCGFTVGALVELDLGEWLNKKISVIGSGSIGAKREMMEVLTAVERGAYVPVVSAVHDRLDVFAAHD